MKLEARNLVKNFGDKRVLQNISLAVESGKALGLLGRNGAGKTTTIRILMGVFPADGGEVLLDGVPIHRKTQRIGYLPEERGLYPKQIILDQLCYLGALRGMERKVAKESALRLLKRMEMGDVANKKLETLSKGNQQKIQLVATLLHDPQIVILDEPFSGLDPVNAMLLKDLVRELIDQGKLVLFSSHQMHYVEEFCQQIVILQGGQIVLEGDLDTIKRGYDRERMLLRSVQAESIAAAMRGQSWLQSATARENTLDLRLKDPARKADCLRFLAEGGFDVDRLEVYEPTLNEIFVAHTEDGV